MMQLGKFYGRKASLLAGGNQKVFRNDAFRLTIELDEGCEVMKDFRPPILYLEWEGVTGTGETDHRSIHEHRFASHEEATAFTEKVITMCKELRDAERPTEDGKHLQEEG